jgi:hypothetical protein
MIINYILKCCTLKRQKHLTSRRTLHYFDKIIYNKIKDDAQFLVLIQLLDQDVDNHYKTSEEYFNSEVTLS